MGKQKSLVDKTYNHILYMIMTKELKPGERIPEQKIAEEFGISRSPVREAMRQLANDGLINIYPNRFAEVANFDESEIKEIGIMRIALDVVAVKLALLYGSQVDFLRLKEIAEKCRQALIDNDDYNRIKYDCDFHLELAKIGQNHLLEKFQNELYLRVQFTVSYLDSKPDELYKNHIDQHTIIADALMAHDEKTAIDTIKNHINTFYDLDEYYPHDFLTNFA